MFGSGGGGFGSGSGAFGQSKLGGGFGSTSGGFGQSSSNTGTTGAFGSGAAGAGGTSNTATGGGFGSFGRSTASGFGAASGGFGAGTGTTGATTGAFGGTGGAFGQASQAQGSSLFGGASTSGGFGQPATGGFGMGAAATAAGSGSARAKFEPVPENPENGRGNLIQSISAMDAYKAFSPEELRLEDYTAGRKKADAQSAVSGFGQTATGGGFGQTSAGGFGSSTGAFGQAASGSTGFGSSTGGGFGQTSTAGTGFGQASSGGFGSSSTGAFGASKPTGFGQTTTGGFGSSGTGAFGSTGTGAFGAAPATSTAGGFGQPAAGGGFGQSTTGGGFGQTATGGGFGQTSTGGFGSSTGAFGQTASSGFGAKPAFGTGAGGFGATAQPAAATGGFGQPAAGGFGATAGSSLFGGGSTTGAATGGAFGQPAASGAASTGLFGSAPAAGATGGGLFGAKPATGGGSSLFGGAAATGTNTGSVFGAQPATSGAGMFGSTPAAASTGGGLFGGASNTGGGLFGAKPATAATGGGLFGAQPAAGGLGLGAPAAAGTTGSGLFGAQPAATGTTGGGLFGNTGTTAATGGSGLFGGANTSSGGLFGAKPAATTGGGLFGGSSTSGGGLFGGAPAAGAQNPLQPAGQPGSFFGQPAAVQQPALLQAQIDQQPYGVSALFDTSKLASKAAGARVGSSHLTATPLRVSAPGLAAAEKEAERKKRGLSLQLLASPRVASAASAGSRLRSRGFAAPSAAVVARKAAAAEAGATAPAKALGTPAGKGRELAGMFGRDGFLSPDGQLPHTNVKRLVIARKPSFGSAASTAAAAAVGADESPVRGRASSHLGGLAADVSPVPAPRVGAGPWANDTPRAHAGPKAGKARSATVGGDDAGECDAALAAAEQGYLTAGDDVCAEDLAPDSDDDGGEAGAEGAGGVYWMRPPLDELRAMSTQQLRAVRNFTVGCTGVGQVSFNRAVDLTSVGALSGIAGGVVLFDDRVCTVYPDESNKPPRGQGLNVPATISLHDCWPVDRTTGERISRMDDPRVRKHIRRLRKIDETEFVDFVGGTWIFRVEHFSRYGLDDNQEDGYDDEDLVEASPAPQGFGKATAHSAQQTQSHLGGSRAVATTRQQTTQPRTAPQHAPSAEAAAADSGSETDILATSSQSDDEGDDDGPVRVVQAPVVPVTQRPPPRQLLLSARHAASLRRAPVMRVSLFSTTSEPLPPQPAGPSHPASGGVERKQASGGCKRKSSVLRTSPARRARATALDLPHPQKYLRARESRVARSVLAGPQPYEQSLTHGRSGVRADAGLMMARSFRVAFGPQGQLVYLGGHASSVVVVDSIARHLHAAPTGGVRPSGAALELVRQQHLGVVRAQWEHALIRADASGGPGRCPRVTFREDATIASVLDSLGRVAPASSDSGNSERRVLELASVLFDHCSSSSDAATGQVATAQQKDRVRTVQQRQALTKWLMSAVYSAVQGDLRRAGQGAAPAAASVLALLTGHRIEAACLAATSHRDYRLATLVAQCGGGAVGGGGNDGQVQALVRAQLDRMAATAVGRAPDMAPEYRRVYEVLAGNASGAVAAGVDWKRAFGLTLWYAQSPADPVAGAVAAYEREAVTSSERETAKAAPPLPAWLFAGADGAALATASVSQLQRAAAAGDAAARLGVDLQARGVWDPAFQLLKLHSDAAYPLESALPCESFSAARGDVRLPAVLAWLLAVVCAARGFDDAQPRDGGAWTSAAYDRLLAGWALQLETLGLWHWACFVLLQLSSPAHRAHAIRALLERSLPSSQPTATLPPAAGADLLRAASGAAPGEDADAVEEQLRFVLYELQLPREWLFDAYVTRSRYDRNWAEARAGAAAEPAVAAAAQPVGHSVQLAAAQRTTASGRPIVPSFFRLGPQRQQQQQPQALGAFRPGVLTRPPLDADAEAVLRQVVWQLSAGRLAAAHALVLQRVAPDAVLRGDYRLLARILDRLDPREYAGVPAEAWAAGGQVYQRFIAAVDGLPAVLERIAAADDLADMEASTQQVHAIYRQLCALQTVLPALLAQFDGPAPAGALGFYDGSEANWYVGAEASDLRVKYSVAVSDMAAVVTGMVHELGRAVPTLEPPAASAAAPAADAAADLPLAQDMRIRRTYELARSCFGSLVSSGLEA